MSKTASSAGGKKQNGFITRCADFQRANSKRSA